jgi:quercetin dioxygenase-like cupin family protein
MQDVIRFLRYSMKVLFLILAVLSTGIAQADEAVAMPSRQNLLKQETNLPSNSVITNVIRVEFPAGYKTPSHTHEGQGPRYIVKGHLKISDATKTQEYGPGEVFWETGEAMTVENIGGSDAEFIIFELAPIKK